MMSQASYRCRRSDKHVLGRWLEVVQNEFDRLLALLKLISGEHAGRTDERVAAVGRRDVGPARGVVAFREAGGEALAAEDLFLRSSRDSTPNGMPATTWPDMPIGKRMQRMPLSGWDVFNSTPNSIRRLPRHRRTSRVMACSPIFPGNVNEAQTGPCTDCKRATSGCQSRRLPVGPTRTHEPVGGGIS